MITSKPIYPNTATDAVMTETAALREYIPDSCRDLLDMEANGLRSEIPALARHKERMGEVEQAVKSLPSHHDLHLGDARDLSMVYDKEDYVSVE